MYLIFIKRIIFIIIITETEFSKLHSIQKLIYKYFMVFFLFSMSVLPQLYLNYDRDKATIRK